MKYKDPQTKNINRNQQTIILDTNPETVNIKLKYEYSICTCNKDPDYHWEENCCCYDSSTDSDDTTSDTENIGSNSNIICTCNKDPDYHWEESCECYGPKVYSTYDSDDY